LGIRGFLGGLLGGSVSGILTALGAQKILTALGGIGGMSAFGAFLSNGLFNGGLRVGSGADFNAMKSVNSIPNES